MRRDSMRLPSTVTWRRHASGQWVYAFTVAGLLE